VNGPNNIENERLLRAGDVSRILNISRALAYRLLQKGEIPTVRINHAVRVKPSDLKAYVERSRKQVSGL